MNEVFWPPSYYILRDRIPFFLTLLYMHRAWFHPVKREVIGGTLYFVTFAFTVLSSILYLTKNNLTELLGISWSLPSPIEWGLFITVFTIILYLRGVPTFEAYYTSFITATFGGWLYEFIPLVMHYDFLTFFKVNAVKVFFMEFQILCLPILIYVLGNYNYKPSRL